MNNIVTLIIILTVFTLTVQAQNGRKAASLGLDVGLPIGNMSKSVGYGVGGSFKGFYGLADEADITLTIGYISFSENNNSGICYSLIPVLVGYRLKHDHLYIEPQFGFNMMKVKFDRVDLGETVMNTKMSYGIGAGYSINNLDVGLRYQDVSANGGGINLIALRVGYTFAF